MHHTLFASNPTDYAMVSYRRDYTPGALYFFTLTLKNRQASYLTTYSSLLGNAFRYVRNKAYFTTHAVVVLPDHLHVIWQLPLEDYNYSLRWRLIKTRFTQELIKQNVLLGKNYRGEYDLWQKRFWEHRLRDDNDVQQHMDYIHYNPVKHGYVMKPIDWQFSSIHRYIEQGVLPQNWGSDLDSSRITLR
jgi:putative transposase